MFFAASAASSRKFTRAVGLLLLPFLLHPSPPELLLQLGIVMESSAACIYFEGGEVRGMKTKARPWLMWLFLGSPSVHSCSERRRMTSDGTVTATTAAACDACRAIN